MNTYAVKPNFFAIVAIVLVAHAALGWFVLRESTPTTVKLLPQKVVVRTVPLIEQPSHTPAAAPVVQQKPSPAAAPKAVKEVAKKSEPPPKPKVADKPKPVKQPEVKKQPEKPVVSAERQAAVEKARASLAQLQQETTPKATPVAHVAIALPTISSSTAEVPSNQAAPDPTYMDELVIRLKTLLRLPEYGEVKAEITLDRSGKVTALRILQSESDADRRYVEVNVPKSKFPDFGKHFVDETQHTFTLVLSNDL